ncbi:MAG: hypothetical protein ACTSX8_10410 [Alphaproteobacteria bacterium]
MSKLAEARLTGARTGTNVRHTVGAVLRRRVFSRLTGYEDLPAPQLRQAGVDDSERLSADRQVCASTRRRLSADRYAALYWEVAR